MRWMEWVNEMDIDEAINFLMDIDFNLNYYVTEILCPLCGDIVVLDVPLKNDVHKYICLKENKKMWLKKKITK